MSNRPSRIRSAVSGSCSSSKGSPLTANLLGNCSDTMHNEWCFKLIQLWNQYTDTFEAHCSSDVVYLPRRRSSSGAFVIWEPAPCGTQNFILIRNSDNKSIFLYLFLWPIVRILLAFLFSVLWFNSNQCFYCYVLCLCLVPRWTGKKVINNFDKTG